MEGDDIVIDRDSRCEDQMLVKYTFSNALSTSGEKIIRKFIGAAIVFSDSL